MHCDSQTSRFEFLFPSLTGFTQPPFQLMPIGSYVRSTDCNCVSRSQKITRCIDIPVVMRPALGAVPFTNIQRQRLNDVTTISTALTAGEPTVNLNKGTSVPLALVVKLSNQLSPSCITNTECKLGIFHHILNCQILNNDGLVFTHQLSSQFMEEVFTAIRNFTVDTSNFNSCLVSIVRLLLLTAKRFLNPFKFPAMPFKVSGVGNFIHVRCDQQASNPYIQSNRLCAIWECLNVGIIHQQRNVPASAWVKLDCNRGWFASIWQWATPLNWQYFFTLCKNYLSTLPRECRTSEFSAPSVMPLFEVGLNIPTSIEVSKRFLKVHQSLLQRYTTNLAREIANLPASSIE